MSGRAAVSASRASASSRSLRSCVAPSPLRWSASRSAAPRRVGICTSQLGAYWPSSAMTRLASRPPTQPSEGLQHWQISVANPILFDALPVTDPQRFLARCPRYEGLHQGGLANASLPGHEAHLPLAPQGLCPPPLHLGALRLPPYQQRRERGRDEGKGRSREAVGGRDRRHEPGPP